MDETYREEPATILERLIVARYDLEERLEALAKRQAEHDRDLERYRTAVVEKQLEYDDLAQALAPLAIAGAVRQIYHDAYIPGQDYVSALVEIRPTGTVHVSELERGHGVRWPAGVPDGAHAATDAFPTGEEGETPELSDELVMAALKPEEGDGLWERYRNHITAGPGRDVP